jgi:dephospho-CoA kinase
VIVVDAALLPEWGSLEWLDLLVVVDADQDTCVERCCRNPRFKASDVRARMQQQFSREDKARQADIIIPNYGSLDELRRRAERVYSTLLGIARKEG